MKGLFFIPFACISLCGYAQKIYGVVNLTTPFSGISHTNGHNKQEFRPSVARINFSWGIDLIFKAKKVSHKISVEQVPFEYRFKIINKFMLPPNNDRLLGISQYSYGVAIDHFIFSYALQREGKKEKGFLFHTKIRFNCSLGAGISLNRSKSFYEKVYSFSSGSYIDQWTYLTHEAVHHRDGFGLFLRGTGGFDFINKKGRRKLSFNVFYNQGVKNMAHFDIHYAYGYHNDPSKRVDVPKQTLRSRGTTFGISLGVPITLKK